MKLIGVTNGKQILTSVAHYDYRSFGSGENYIMMDGGVCGLNDFGYNRFSVTGEKLWFEVPQTYAELYNDWNRNIPRKYGLWNLEDVRLLSPEEIPDTDSFQWRAENTIWGTNGPSGTDLTTYVLLKDCGQNHLQKIAKLCKKRGIGDVAEIAEYWLNQKTKRSNSFPSSLPAKTLARLLFPNGD